MGARKSIISCALILTWWYGQILRADSSKNLDGRAIPNPKGMHAHFEEDMASDSSEQNIRRLRCSQCRRAREREREFA